MGNSKTITINTEGGDVVVRKLALGDYAALLRALKKLPAELGQFVQGTDKKELQNMDVILAALPTIIADAIPEFCAVLAAATDKEADFFINELDLADGIDVLGAALQLNDYNRIFNSVKKLMAGAPATPAPAQTPTDPAA